MNCFFFSCFNMVCCCLDWCAKKEPSPRTVWVGKSVDSNFQQFPPNVIRNQKYSIFSFIPVVRTFTLFDLRLYLGPLHKLCCHDEVDRWYWNFLKIPTVWRFSLITVNIFLQPGVGVEGKIWSAQFMNDLLDHPYITQAWYYVSKVTGWVGQKKSKNVLT